MKKSWIIQIVKNTAFEIGKEFGVELEAIIDYESEGQYVEFKLVGKDLLDRSLRVRHDFRDKYRVSHGIHSPSQAKSDMLQLMVVGKVANRLFIENKF